ncbi:hypothetical protein [Streptomyces sp. NPDC059639]|uniref:hypothetical protein n=1 Tax=Streptomyces sp. NPDC059639 TaxID=3346891 RepID=UPI0036CA5449
MLTRPRSSSARLTTALTLALGASGLLLLAAPAAGAATTSPRPGPAATATSEGGPSYGNETVDFTGEGFSYSGTASGFETDGTAYFEQTLLHLGEPGGLRWSTTRSHS